MIEVVNPISDWQGQTPVSQLGLAGTTAKAHALRLCLARTSTRACFRERVARAVSTLTSLIAEGLFKGLYSDIALFTQFSLLDSWEITITAVKQRHCSALR